MKNKILNIFFLAVFSLSVVICGGKAAYDVYAATTLTTTSTTTVAADTTGPKLKDLSISPSTVPVGSSFVVTMVVTDDSSGVKSAKVALESPSGEYSLFGEASYGDASGNWRVSLAMPFGSEGGTWKVLSVTLIDNSGNETNLSYGNGVSTVFTVTGGTEVNTTTISNTCVSFEYGDWSACQKNGTQTRAITKAYPLDCVDGNPVLTQPCTYLYQCIDSRPYLNLMNKENCISSHGTWDSSNCICTCPTGWYFYGTGCIYNWYKAISDAAGTNTTATKTNTSLRSCIDSDYSDWSECEENGTQIKTLLTTSNCVGGDTLTQACKYVSPEEQALIDNVTQITDTTNHCNANRPYLDAENKYNCENSKGNWNSVYCTCTCPENYHLQGTSCVYTSTNIDNACERFEYSEWTQCIDGKQTREITDSFPEGCTGGSPEEVDRTCIVTPTCTKDEWVCGEWGDCSTKGVQKRTCTLSYDCKGVTDEAPKTEQTCVSSTAVQYCNYTYTDWGACTDGKQYRQIASRTPDKCKDTTTDSLMRICEAASTCQYTYSDWGACIDGNQTRTVISAYPTGCNGTPETTKICADTGVTSDCLKAGITNKSDCDIYTYKNKVSAYCKNGNLSFNNCREYVVETAGKPEKCNDISGAACDNLIDNVILSDLKTAISTEVKQELSSVAGSSAVINTQEKTITVEVPSSGGGSAMARKVEVDTMPLTSTTAEAVSVGLLPVSASSGDNLSPVAITFDTDGDSLPDDVEKRLGTDPLKKDTDGDGVNDDQELVNGTSPLDPSTTAATTIVLSGIDKAVVEGKTLEQPKAVAATVSASLVVKSVQSVQAVENKANLKFEGKAQPNQVITLYIYSAMPIVVTVQADSNGNWVYELDKTLIDGTHEVYVAINDDEGRIVEASLPTPFFIAEAQAVSVDEFVGATTANVSEKTDNMMVLYVLGGVAVVLVLIAAVLIIRQKYSEEE